MSSKIKLISLKIHKNIFRNLHQKFNIDAINILLIKIQEKIDETVKIYNNLERKKT